jgi:UDP-N-acetylmuramyl pentapeptide phosphotransferase/UDP-N-acetylglucosamine-1-phosphate transferase
MPWSETSVLYLIAGISAVISVSATMLAHAYAYRRGLLDQPGERRSHHAATPRGGGIGIALATLMCCIYFAWQGEIRWLYYGMGLLLVTAISAWDDHRPLSASLRLFVHLLAATVIAIGVYRFASLPYAVLAWLLVPFLVNVWNFMDGINGIATSQAMLVAFFLFMLLDGTSALFAVATAAACLAFLPFNMPKAKIFLGDVGSGALGCIVAILLLESLQKAPSFLYWPLIALPVSAFACDSGMTLLRRMWRGEPWWQPHVQHLYQTMARRYGHLPVTLTYAVWTLVMGLIMLPGAKLSGEMAALLAIGIASLAACIWLYLQRQAIQDQAG